MSGKKKKPWLRPLDSWVEFVSVKEESNRKQPGETFLKWNYVWTVRLGRSVKNNCNSVIRRAVNEHAACSELPRNMSLAVSPSWASGSCCVTVHMLLSKSPQWHKQAFVVVVKTFFFLFTHIEKSRNWAPLPNWSLQGFLYTMSCNAKSDNVCIK